MAAPRYPQPPLLPSRPRDPNSFFLFLQEKTRNLGAEESRARRAVTKAAKLAWSQVSTARKQKYVNEAAEIRESKYKAALEQYSVKLGQYRRDLNDYLRCMSKQSWFSLFCFYSSLQC